MLFAQDPSGAAVNVGAYVAAAVTFVSLLAVLARAWRFLGRAERHLAIVDALDRHMLDLDVTATSWLRSIDLTAAAVAAHSAQIAAHEERLNDKHARLERLDRQVTKNTEHLDDIETWIGEHDAPGES